MKRTIFCVALTLCAAIMAGCAVQAPDRVQSPISAQTELPQMRKADDAAEVVTTVVLGGGSVVTQVWGYLGEVIFNMLVLVGLVKGADRVVREMFGM